MKCPFPLILILVLSPSVSRAQTIHVSDDYEFISYLLGNGMNSDASVLLSSTSYHPCDTLDFLKAWTSYSLKDLDKASQGFGRIPEESSFFDKSSFFNVICLAHLGDYKSAENALDRWAPRFSNSSRTVQDAYILQRSGLALLQGSKSGYLEWSSLHSPKNPLLDDNFRELEKVYERTLSRKPVSPLTAAAASTIIPGSGQFLAGEKAKGILTFLLEGAFAAIIIEQYRHYGPEDWRTAVWAGLGLSVHLINIYGATVSVKLTNDRNSQYRSTAVLYNIHIPLRTVFGQRP